MRHGLKNLKLLEIGGCLTQVVFQLEGFEFDGGEGEHFLSFPSLETLRFSDLPELECIWKGPSQFINPQNLSILSVENCPKLRRIFSTTLARHLSKLEVLSIEWCSALEQIIVQDDEEEEQHQQAACFSNLLEITIYDCDNLKSLFHVNVARDLQQLKKLDIARCEKLEQIIFQDDEEEEQHQQAACFSNLLEISIVGCHNLKKLSIDDCEKLEQIFVGDNAVEECKEIVLPGVWLLNLLNLPKLVHLCPVGCHLILPSLTHLWVTICPRIAARFSVDQNGSLHVKSEARQIDETNFAMEIDCSSTDQIRQLTSR
ncbi:hypothetical protein KPL71_001495 [Citrus sinensis]|uniref:Uncharacterized protein n=1 Tax=Citrus sinensis TaxID=2711 RepID=A0ACB8NXC3_CITSI|nr:hypothetical protein KPL71_001495 [Citrus sinensis]